MEKNSSAFFSNVRNLVQSVNEKLVVLEYSILRQDYLLQTTLLKMINLVGQWPQSPCKFMRKNYPTLIQFVMFNQNNKTSKEFIQDAINCILEFHNQQIFSEITLQKRSQLPNQFFVSNAGKRVSFWLEEETFNNFISNQKLSSLFKPFTWISQNQEQKFNNQIEYGSENFINLIQMFSLDSMMKLLSLSEYTGFAFKEIEESIHAVTSLINYNYRFFYPPKDATRFLKKTSGITLTCNVQLKEKRSKRWAEQVFLDNIFELRPTKCLARILANPSGPIYLEKYNFSEKFYTEIQKLYFLGEIEDYFDSRSLRNYKKYFTFLSRARPQELLTTNVKEELQRLKSEGWVQQKIELFSRQNNLSQSDSESSEEQEETINKNNQKKPNQMQKDILNLYKNSENQTFQILKTQLNTRILQTKIFETQIQSLITVTEERCAERVVLIDEFANSCRAGNISFCNSCGFSNSKIANTQKQLVEFISLFNYGNDSFCQSCSDLSIKDRILIQKIRQFQEKQQAMQQVEVKQVMKASEKQEMKMKQVLQKKQENLYVQSQKSIESTKVETKADETMENKTDEEKFEQFIGELMGSNNIEQDQDDQNKKQQIQQTLLEAHQKLRFKAQEQRKVNVGVERNTFERRYLLGEKYSLAWYLMMLRLKNQCNEFINPEYFHDTFQLSFPGTELTSNQYRGDELLDVYEYYFSRMLYFVMKTNPGNETELSSIPSILQNLRHIKQIKYQKIESNVFEAILLKCINSNAKQQKIFMIETQQTELTNKLHLFVDQKKEIYQVKIAEHYRTYKQIMNQQYRVTEFQLKEMIAKFQADLKLNNLKTTQEFLFQIRWLILFVSEYVQAKTIQIKTQSILPQEQNGISYFANQVQFLMNILAMFVHVFNQPGQLKIIELAQNEVLNLIILIVENQKSIKEKLKQQFDPQVVEILLQDMLDHFVAKISCDAKQDAKKLTTKHLAKFKATFDVKLKTIKIKRLFDCNEQLKTYQFKLAQQSLNSYANKNISFSKNLYIDGQLNNTPGYFSSLLFMHRYFEKHQRTYYHNFEIWALMTLLGSVTVMGLKKNSLVMKSKSESQHQIKIGVVYKLILETLQKSQCAPELIGVYKSGNKLLLNLTSYLISESYNITLNPTSNQELAQKIKLYVQRTRYRYIKNTPNIVQFYAETTEILDFLFKNRNLFFDVQKAQSFETQFHTIIQIVILNTLPLFNIQIAYKSELKEIGKTLKHFDVNDGYNQIEDYYLKVLSFRHNKSKEKRKKEIQAKKDKSQAEK